MMRLRLLLERMEVLLMRRIWTLVAAQLCVVSMLVLWRDLEPRELRMRVVLMLLEYLLLLMLLMSPKLSAHRVRCFRGPLLLHHPRVGEVVLG